MTGGIIPPVHGGFMIRILFLLFFIFYFFSGCVWEYPGDELGNNPLELPEHPGYCYDKYEFKSQTVVVDGNTGKVVGRINMEKRSKEPDGASREAIENITLGADGNIYVAVTLNEYGGGDPFTPGRIIRVISPETGKIVKEIEVDDEPQKFFPIDDRYVVVTRPYFPISTLSLIDTKTGRLVTEKEYPTSSNLSIDERKYVWGYFFESFAGDTAIWRLKKLDPRTLDFIGSYPLVVKKTGVPTPPWLGQVWKGWIYTGYGNKLVRTDTTGTHSDTISSNVSYYGAIVVNDRLWFVCGGEKVVVVDPDSFTILKEMQAVWLNGPAKYTFSESLQRVFIYNTIFDAKTGEVIGTLDYPIEVIK